MNFNSATYISFPNTLASWPWPRTLNPHYSKVKKDSIEWIAGFRCLDQRAQRAFDACNFNLLGSLGYPCVNEDILRFGCDVVNILFLFDEFSDCGEENSVEHLRNVVMDALRNPSSPRPANELAIGEIVRQFWERATSVTSVSTQKRFVEAFDRYTASVVQEAQDRMHARIRPIDEYLALRRDTSGIEPCIFVIEFGLDIPPDVFEHPVMKRVLALAVEMVLVTNDMYSFNVEQARGDPHNLIISIINTLSTDLTGAFNWVVAYYREISTEFLSIYHDKLPTFTPEVDVQVRKYVEGLGHWVRGNDTWSFETERYFGKLGEEVRIGRRVMLLRRDKRVATAGVVSGLDIMVNHAMAVEVSA